MRLSLKAVLCGGVLSILIIILDVGIIMKVQQYGLCVDTIGAGAIFCLCILILVVNPVLRLVRRGFALDPPDLLSAHSIVLVASTVPTWGLLCTLVGMIAGLRYLSSPENDWDAVVLPHIKPWLILQDENAVKGFYEAIPADARVPYEAWIVPLLAWFAFVGLLYLGGFFLAVIFRKQWVENERLIFPLMVLPVEMVRGGEGGGIPRLFRSVPMWLGFGTSGLVVALQIASSFHPAIPRLECLIPVHSYPILDGNARVSIDLYFVVVGFAFLLETRVACSFWFFPLFFAFQNGLMASYGARLEGPNEPFGGYTAFSTFEGMGGMICLSLAVVWVGREQFRRVFRKVWTGAAEVDDTREPLSYRAAGLGLIAVFILLLAWLTATGMPLAVSVLLLVSSFVLLLTLTRIVCQGGVGFVRGQCQPIHMVSYSVPAEVVTPQGYGALGIHYAWIAGQRNNALSSVFNTLKIMETSKVRPRIMFIALLITFVLSFAVSAWVVLTMCYRYGALNSFRPWFFLHMPEFAGDFIRGKIEHPPAGGLVRERAFAAGIGAAIVGGLMLLRAWVPSWPIHPLGFPVADSWICQQAWLSIFVAWLLKILILKFGGLAVYRKAVPYFLGLILGQIVPVSLWVFVCWLAGGTRGIEIPIGLY